jgi:hypothetical protein
MGWRFPWSAGPPLPPRGPGERRHQSERRRQQPPDQQETAATAAALEALEAEHRRQEQRQQEQRQHPRHALVGAALNVTVLVQRDGERLAIGSVWDLSYGGVCVWVPDQPRLELGETVDLELVTAQDAGSIRLPASLCWRKLCDGQWFIGFQFAPPGLPPECSLSRLLGRSRPSAQRQPGP